MDYPFGQRFANTATLQEASHDGTSTPIAWLAAHGANQRIAIRRKSKCAVDPSLDPHLLQRWITFKAQCQLVLNPVGLLLKKLDAIVPGRTIQRPVLVVDLIDTKQNTLLILAKVSEPLQIDCHWHFKVDLLQLRDRIRDEIVMLERCNR